MCCARLGCSNGGGAVPLPGRHFPGQGACLGLGAGLCACTWRFLMAGWLAGWVLAGRCRHVAEWRPRVAEQPSLPVTGPFASWRLAAGRSGDGRLVGHWPRDRQAAGWVLVLGGGAPPVGMPEQPSGASCRCHPPHVENGGSGLCLSSRIYFLGQSPPPPGGGLASLAPGCWLHGRARSATPHHMHHMHHTQPHECCWPFYKRHSQTERVTESPIQYNHV